MSEEIKGLIENLNKGFETFKNENETRLKALETKNHVDPVIEEKVRKIADDIAAMSTLQAQLTSIEKAVAQMEAKGVVGHEGEKGKVYNSIGDQLKDIMTIGNPSSNRTELAAAIDRLSKVQAAASGLNEQVPSEGGFLVEKDSANILNEGSIATGLLAQRCFRVPISENSNGIKIKLIDETSRANGSRYGGIQAYWAAEADTVTASKPKFRQVELELKKLFAIMYATEEELRDAGALTALVNRWFPAEVGFKIDDGIINGTGSGMPLGIANAGCTISQAIETGQVRATSPILYDNIAKMYSRQSNLSASGLAWFINQDLLPDIMMMTVQVGTGGVPVFLPPNGAAGQPYMTLLNKPIIPIEQCAAKASLGDIIFADMSEYMIIDKGGIQSNVSIHVRFLYDEQTFKWTYRIDGQPLKNAALTPFSGGNTRSPFVVLAAS